MAAWRLARPDRSALRPAEPGGVGTLTTFLALLCRLITRSAVEFGPGSPSAPCTPLRCCRCCCCWAPSRRFGWHADPRPRPAHLIAACREWTQPQRAAGHRVTRCEILAQRRTARRTGRQAHWTRLLMTLDARPRLASRCIQRDCHAILVFLHKHGPGRRPALPYPCHRHHHRQHHHHHRRQRRAANAAGRGAAVHPR